MRPCASPKFKAGVSMHPSHPAICNILQEDEQALLSATKCAQLILPASNDSDTCKPNGLASTVLNGRVTIVPFDNMTHGWTTRGDVTQPNVEDDVKKAFDLAVRFFKEHVTV